MEKEVMTCYIWCKKKKNHQTFFEIIVKVCEIGEILPLFAQFAHIRVIQSDGVSDGERPHDELSIGAIRKKFIKQFLRK